MDDLAELQALLGAVQKQESKQRLNERNCRELLVKLIEKELVKVPPRALAAHWLARACVPGAGVCSARSTRARSSP